jgi:hypothetical protein
MTVIMRFPPGFPQYFKVVSGILGHDRFLLLVNSLFMIHPIIRRYISYAIEKASLNKSGINLGKG